MLETIATAITLLHGGSLAADKLRGNEAIIRALRTLGLPTRPPVDDFESLYVYTLVHYGVNKAPQLLELFRDPRLIAAFRGAHAGGELSGAVAAATAAVSAMAFGDDLSKLTPDLRAEIGEFATQFEGFVDSGRSPYDARLEGEVRDIRALVAAQSFDHEELRRLRAGAWKSRLDDIAQIANSGRYTEARSMAEAVLNEMGEGLSGAAPEDSQAAAHLMLAQLALATDTPDAEAQAQRHLDQATAMRPQSGASPTVRRIVVLLALRSEPAQAVEQLRGLTDRESALELFLTYLNTSDFVACDRMLRDGLIDLSQALGDSDVARAAVLYHGSVGHAASLKDACRVLLQHDRNGRNLRIAALASERTALHRYTQLCREYNMPPVPVFVNVPELVDRTAHESALAYLTEAAEWFSQKQARVEAAQAAEEAVRIAVRLDQPETAARMVGLVTPPNPAVGLAAAVWHDDPRFSPGEISLHRLGELVGSYVIEPEAALELAVASAIHNRALLPTALSLLARHRAFFVDCAQTRVAYIRDVVRLVSLNANTDTALVSGDLARIGASVLAESDLPTEFEWYREIVECERLLFESDQVAESLELASEAAERARDLAVPGNPEVLWATFLIAAKKEDWGAALAAASASVASARTESFLRAYLSVVLGSEGPSRFVEELNAAVASAGLPEDDLWTRGTRAQALLELGGDEAAVNDLSWLLAHAESIDDASRPALKQAAMDLARVLRNCARYGEAVGVLERADRLWGRVDPTFVAAKADTQLVSGDGHGAYRTLVEAVPRFAGVPAFDVALLHTGFRTGNDNQPEVRDAFSRAVANPDGELVRRIEVPAGEGLGELGEMLSHGTQIAEQVHAMYRDGKLPFVALCSAPVVNQTICASWWGMGHHRIARYASLGSEKAEINWLREMQPDAAVIDYVSLLLLDELLPASHGGAVQFALRCFPRLYLPTSLRALLEWEAQHLLAVQPSEDQVAASVLDSLAGSGKLEEIPGDFTPGDLGGTLAAARFAAERDLPCVSAYVDHYPDTATPLMPLLHLTDHLAQLGVLDMLSLAELRTVIPQVAAPESWDWHCLDSRRELVIDSEALQALARHSLLNDVLAWVRQVHVPSAGLLWLGGRVAHTHKLQETRERFRRLRSALSQDGDRVVWVGVGPHERPVDFPHSPGGAWDLAFDYFADLFNVALKVGAPLWTDDRATKAAAFTVTPIPRIGSYAVLARARETGQLGEEDWLGMAQRMTESGVLSLGVDAHYLLRLMQRTGGQ